MKKKVLLLMACFMAFVVVLAACGNEEPTADTPSNDAPATTAPPADDTAGGDDTAAGEGVEGTDELYLDADGNLRFHETRTISVAMWERDSDRLPNFDESYWADWIVENMLATHNVQVEWEVIPRWSEGDHISMLLGGGAAPDVGMTFGGSIVESYANMGGMINLIPYLDSYRHLLPNLYYHLGEDIIYWNFNPEANELHSLMGREAIHGRINTFIREDWLNALDLPIPTTHEEFEATLLAFRDRYDELPGDLSINDVIPFMSGSNVGWDIGAITESFIPSDISERDWYVYGWDAMRFMHRDAIYQAASMVNRWFYEGLMWDDFVIAEGSIGQDRIRLGHVGSVIANWDLPFRPADRWILDMRDNIGPDANFIPIAPFPSDSGEPQIFLAAAAQRNIFFPHTNNEVLASLLYLDFMSRPDTLFTLQVGVEGIHFETNADGTLNFLAEEEGGHQFPDNMLMPSARNFDITVTANGISHLDTLFNSYGGIEPAAVEASRNFMVRYGRAFAPVNVRPIAAQDGMTGLEEERTEILQILVAGTSPENFTARFNELYEAYLNMGGRAIIEERLEAWIEEFGDVENR